MKAYPFLAFLLALGTTTTSAQDLIIIGSITSPDSSNTVQLLSNDSLGELYYSVVRNEKMLVAPSRLGLHCALPLYTGLTVDSVTYSAFEETFTLPVGKTSTYTNHYNEGIVHARRNSTRMQIQFRTYDEGIAFRYVFPKSRQTIKGDSTQIHIPSMKYSWAMEYQKPYERHYDKRSWAATLSMENQKFCLPILVQTSYGSDYHILVSEAHVGANGATSAIVPHGDKENGHLLFVPQGEQTTPAVATPLPWRVIFVGNPRTFVESTMVENLNPPAANDNWDWVKPGLSTWDWGALDGHVTKDLNFIRQCIDMAAEMGWSYFTLDDGWEGAGYELTEVTDYAREKGVGVFIWSHHNRFQNTDNSIRSILRNWKDRGFVGTKIDFFESDEQSMMQKMDRILRIAADEQMMVNFHGCTKPTGRRRTYPNHMSSEGVYGNEQYFGNHEACPADHNINLCLTRNVIGPMEYTPIEFATSNGVIRHKTTWAHQVATAILFESSIQTIPERRENLFTSPAVPLLKTIPARWDETRCIEAAPDQYITIARRDGDDWFVSSVSKNARTVILPLNFLGEGAYTAQIWYDGTCSSDIAYAEKSVSRDSKLSVRIKATGGASIRISKQPVNMPVHTLVESEGGTLQNTSIQTDGKGHCSGSKYVGNIGKGRTIANSVTVEQTGKYNLTLYYISLDQRNLYIQVNGGEKVYHKLPNNGFSWDSDGLQMQVLEVELKAGRNTLIFGNDEDWAPNLDRFVISPSRELQQDTEDGITMAPSSDTQKTKGHAYDLAGKPLASPARARGIVVQDGKKILY